jgi:hypothetical protein
MESAFIQSASQRFQQHRIKMYVALTNRTNTIFLKPPKEAVWIRFKILSLSLEELMKVMKILRDLILRIEVRTRGLKNTKQEY